MIDPFAALIRAEGDEDFATLYEAAAELVCWLENTSAQAQVHFPVCFDQLVTAFNACESAIAEHRRLIAEMAGNDD